jgi:hypothetical protein
MASHFVALNRGVEGSKYSDFITGTSATANVIELRIDDASTMRAKDVETRPSRLQAFLRKPGAMGAGWVCDPAMKFRVP